MGKWGKKYPPRLKIQARELKDGKITGTASFTVHGLALQDFLFIMKILSGVEFSKHGNARTAE